jgi:uncharacterized metal-binding protein YceD (DUF177 family)
LSDGKAKPSEFSRTVPVQSLGPGPRSLKIEAADGERRRLAERFGLLQLDRLSAAVELCRQPDDAIQASGHLVADVVQACVITLEPVAAHIEADFACRYAPHAEESEETNLDPLAEEEIEPLAGDEIDLGETVAQQLAMALDPYPRAPGAAWHEGDAEAGQGKEGGKGPFAKLIKLKKP